MQRITDIILGLKQALVEQRTKSTVWFSHTPERKQELVKQFINANFDSNSDVLALNSPDIIKMFKQYVMDNKYITEVLINYFLTPRLHESKRLNDAYQNHFIHYQNPELYSLISLELCFSDPNTGHIFPIPRPHPVIDVPGPLLIHGLTHHTLNHPDGVAVNWTGQHTTSTPTNPQTFVYSTIGFKIDDDVNIVLIDKDRGKSGSILCFRPYAEVIMRMWSKRPKSSNISSEVTQWRLDDSLKQLSQQIKQEHPWICRFDEIKRDVIEANNDYRRYFGEIAEASKTYASLV